MKKAKKKKLMTHYGNGTIPKEKPSETEEFRSELQRLSMENKILIKRIEEYLEQIETESKEDGNV